jgi:hypothetical protein
LNTYINGTQEEKSELVDFFANPNAWNIDTYPVILTTGQMMEVFKQDINDYLTGTYIFPTLINSENSFDIYQYM